jgi:outer membrane protein assembly factor BamB
MNLRLGSLCLVLAIIHAGDIRLAAEDWPTWRHDPLRSGVTNEKLAPPLQQLWAFRSRQTHLVPKTQESPQNAKYPWVTWYSLPMSAAGDAIYFNSAADGRTVCLDAATGKKRWEFIAGAAVNRTPTIWDGKVYVGSDDGHVYCLDAKTGTIVWQFKAAPTDRMLISYGKPVSTWPVRTDVAVDKGVAYFAAGVFPHDGTFMFALDAKTGKLLWRNGTQCETGGRSSMAPAGHLFVTRKSIFVPKDCWGYFLNWYTLVGFGRESGGPVHRPDMDEWPQYPDYYGIFLPLYGVRKGDIRYLGSSALAIDKKDRKKTSSLWKVDTPGRWTDIDSVLSNRARKPIFFRYDPDCATVVYADGVLYHSAFDTAGTGSTIYARDAASGKQLWSTEIAERANQIIVANGKLFASTRSGTIYCFAPNGKKHDVIEEPIDLNPKAYADSPAMVQAAEAIIKEGGVTAGYVIVLDCESGQLALELAKRTNLYLIAVFRDASNAAAARKIYSRAGGHVSRVITYHQKAGTKLPFPSFFANLIVSEAAAIGQDLPHDAENLDRILKPIRGVALIGGQQSDAVLKSWIAETKQTDWKIVQAAGAWAKRLRPRLEDAGGWFQANGDAGNTNNSHDGVLKPPLGVVWYGTPHLAYGGRTPGSWIVDGVLLVPEGKLLYAYDEYTGRKLWQRKNAVTDMAAAPGSIFLRYHEMVARLDPATGKILQQYLPASKGDKWTKMAPDRDGKTLYLSTGGSIIAMDVASGKPRWVLGGPGQKKQWKEWTVIGDGYMYIRGGGDLKALRTGAIAEMRAYLKANDPERLKQYNREVDKHTFSTFTTVDTKTGKVLYSQAADVTNAGGALIPSGGFGSGRNARHYNPPVFGCTMAAKDVIIFCTTSGADKGWRVWPSGRYGHRSLAVYDGPTGRLLWKKQANYRGRPVVADDTIYAEPWGYDLRTGKRKTRTHPITGKETDWAWCRAGKQCGIFAGSKYFLFGRSTGVGYHDLLTDQGLYTFFHSRMSCTFDAVTGGGMMIKPPMASYCKCSWSLPFTIALGQVATPPSVGQSFAQPGPTLPVKHLYLDFAATGDRRDKNGNLWLRSKRQIGHALLLGHEVKVEMYPGGKDVQHNSRYTHVENTNTPFVFATTIQGMKSCVIPVTAPKDGKGRYRVKLGFVAPPGDKPQQRVFDVQLNGKTVLASFDIVKEAGKSNRAVWKEFVIDIGGDLVLGLVAKSDKPTAKQMPLISGMQILRE